MWDAIKRFVYRVAPVQAYIDVLEQANVELRAQNKELLERLLRFADRAYAPDQEVAPSTPNPRVVDDMQAYLRQREQETKDRFAQSLGFENLAQYEKEMLAQPNEEVANERPS